MFCGVYDEMEGGWGGTRLQVYACVGNWLLLGKQLFLFFFFSFLFSFPYRPINPSVRVFQKIDYHTFLNRVWLQPSRVAMQCHYPPSRSSSSSNRAEARSGQVRSGLRPASDPKSYFVGNSTHPEIPAHVSGPKVGNCQPRPWTGRLSPPADGCVC